MTHSIPVEIVTQAPQNVGQAIINYLTARNIRAKVEVTDIHTTKNCRSRLRTTTFNYSYK